MASIARRVGPRRATHTPMRVANDLQVPVSALCSSCDMAACSALHLFRRSNDRKYHGSQVALWRDQRHRRDEKRCTQANEDRLEDVYIRPTGPLVSGDRRKRIRLSCCRFALALLAPVVIEAVLMTDSAQWRCSNVEEVTETVTSLHYEQLENAE